MGARFLKALIRCRDLDASLAFYVDLLGLTVVEEWDDDGDRGFIVEFGSGGGLLELLASNPAHPSHDPDFHRDVVNDKIVLQIQVDAVDDWVDRVDQVEGPVTRPWGNRYLYLRDPDGVSVALFQVLNS